MDFKNSVLRKITFDSTHSGRASRATTLFRRIYFNVNVYTLLALQKS